MPSLCELQAAFTAALDGDDAALLPHLVAGSVPRRTRLAVYRDSVRHNYRKALRAVYPVVERLVGERFFDHAADAYARAQPSRHGDLNRYGEHFATFLAGFPGADTLAYLPDTARLEWAMEGVFHAADAPPQDFAALAAVAEADYPALRLVLGPACRLLASPWPVHRLWQLNQPGTAWDDDFDVTAGGVALLIRRSGHEVELEPLPAAEFALLAELAAGRPLGAACDAALRTAPEFDAGAALQRHLLAGTLRLGALSSA